MRTFHDIARVEGCSIGAAHSRYKRAMDKLRRHPLALARLHELARMLLAARDSRQIGKEAGFDHSHF